MRVLLITASPTNAVRTALEQEHGVALTVADIGMLSRQQALTDIGRLLEHSIPDLLITYRCPWILPRQIFERTLMGAYNIHPSLLPKYPGANPWNDIFRHHERESGVTLHQLTDKPDAGPIVFQASFVIEESDTIETAREKADHLAAQLVGKLCRR